jgi:hypothetical protein
MEENKMNTVKIIKVVLIVTAIIGFIVWMNYFTGNEASSNDKSSTVENSDFYPRNGSKVATEDNPVKCFLDHNVSNTEISEGKSAKYVFEKDPSIFFICNKPANDPTQCSSWASLPAGNYLVYPYESDEIIFTWNDKGKS